MALLPPVHLVLKIGVGIPTAAPRVLLEALENVEVSQSDEGRSGFQLAFRAGRAAADTLKDPIVTHPALTVFSRVILSVVIGGTPTVLMDGLITHQQFTPSVQPGASTFTVTGEDVSLAMDQVEWTGPLPGTSVATRVLFILGLYFRFGLVPVVIPHPLRNIYAPDIATEKVANKGGTDLSYITSQAQENGCVFYIIPGPKEGANIAYFGPKVRAGMPQRSLTWNMGASSTLNSIDFQHDATKPVVTMGWVKDTTLGTLPVVTPVVVDVPHSQFPTLTTYLPFMKMKVGELAGQTDYAGAWLKAIDDTNKSASAAVTASGEVDALRYGGVLQARGLVEVRGVGHTYDGLWYVKSVTHSLKRGEYKQKFSLEREGLGSLSNKVSL